jgi:gliding motility-associated-like protein
MIKKSIIAVFSFLMFHLVNGQQPQKPQFIRNSNDLFGGDLIKENNLNVHYQSQKHKALFLVNKGKDFVFFDSFGFTILSTKKGDSCFVRYDFINPNREFSIAKQGESKYYYTSPQSNEKSYGYKQVVYRNIYDKVDFVVEGNPTGLLKYSFVLRDNASLKNIGFKLSGSFDSLAISNKRFDIIGANYRVIDTGLVASNELGKKVGCWYQKMGKNEIRYEIDPKAKFKQLVIDPFVIKLDTLKNLKYLNSQYKRYGRNVGIEVDFDHHGNVYVYGGDHLTNMENGFCILAKYNHLGSLEWVFQGYDISLKWNYDTIIRGGSSRMYDDILVNKSTEEVYVGQSKLMWPIQLIRLNKDGLGIFKSDTLKGCGFSVAIEFNQKDTSLWALGRGYTYSSSTFIPRELSILRSNGKAQSYDFSKYANPYNSMQELVCGIQDFSGHKYAIISDFYSSVANNQVYKLSYTPGGRVWMSKARMGALSYNNVFFDSNNYKNSDINWDYRANVLAVNQKYLFTYDGQKIGTLSITDGSYIGITDSIPTQTKFYQMGIAADACNHVFLAGDKGQIRCYSFDGSKFTFDTTLQLGSGVVQFIRDVKYDFSTHTILVTGDSILAAVPSPYKDYCDDEILKVNLNKPTACNPSVEVKILNADTNSVYSFQWFLADTNVLLHEHSNKSRTADTLNGLKVGNKYRLRIYRNKIVGHFYRDYIFTAGLPSDTFLQFSRCMGDSFVHNNRAYFSDTLLKDTLLNAQGCDSVVSTQLIFFQNSKFQIYKEICLTDTLVFGGKKIGTAGLYRDTITNHLGCDSVIELTVKVNLPKFRSDTIYFCNLTQVMFNGKLRNVPSLFIDTFSTFKGCDSVVSTQLIFLQSSKSQIYKEICLNDTLVFGGKKIGTAGLYRDTITNHLGCDSVIELTVKVNLPKFRSDTIYFCNQTQVMFNGKLRNVPSLFIDTFSTFKGCDSVVNTMLLTDTVTARFAIDSSLAPTFRFLNLSVNAQNSLWDFGDGENSTTKDAIHKYSDDLIWSRFQPCLVVYNSRNCRDTFCENIDFYTAKEVTIVEGFSPNSDGVNDTFYVLNSKYYPNSELYIMNRYGQIMLHQTQTTQKDLFWDGNYYQPERLLFSSECSEGLYYYYYKYNDGIRATKQGNLYLKR